MPKEDQGVALQVHANWSRLAALQEKKAENLQEKLSNQLVRTSFSFVSNSAFDFLLTHVQRSVIIEFVRGDYRERGRFVLI